MIPNVQRTLPLSREDRLDLIDSIDWDRAGISTRARRSVRDLLKQIEYCSRGDESTVRIVVLAARMGVNRSTVIRAAQAAEAAGLLSVERFQYSAAGRRGNGWRVRYDVIASLKIQAGGRSAGEAHGAPHLVRDAPHPVHDAPHRRQKYRRKPGACKELASSAPHSTSVLGLNRSSIDDGARADDRRNFHASQPGGCAAPDGLEVRRIAESIERKIGPCRHAKDWDLAAKAAVLRFRFGENWLHDAVEGVAVTRANWRKVGKRMHRPWAVLQRILDDSVQRLRGVPLNVLLKQTTVPREAATWRGGDAWHRQEVDRLCDAPREPPP